MADLVASRVNVQDLNTTSSFQVMGSAAAVTYFRGSAVGYLNGTATPGLPTKQFDGTVPVALMGVVKREISTTATSSGASLMIPVKRDGAVSFQFVDAAGAPAVPTTADLGHYVFFRSDWEVSLIPPNAQFPVFAGRIIGIPGMTGCTGLGANDVLVEIDGAVRGFGPQFQQIPFGPTALAGIDASTKVNALTSFVLGRRYWLRRIVLRDDVPFDVANLAVTVFKGAVDLTAGGAIAVAQATSAMGRVTVGLLTPASIASLVFTETDALTVTIGSTGNVTAGSISGYLEILPLQ